MKKKKDYILNEIFEVRLIREVIDTVEDISEIGVINLFLFSCFLSLLGSSQVAFPKGYWYFKYSLVVEGGEPSDFFIFMTQISGLLLIAAGLLMLLFLAF